MKWQILVLINRKYIVSNDVGENVWTDKQAGVQI